MTPPFPAWLSSTGWPTAPWGGARAYYGVIATPPPTCHPITAGQALAATLEVPGVQLPVDEVLEDVEQHADQKRCGKQAHIGCPASLLQPQQRVA